MRVPTVAFISLLQLCLLGTLTHATAGSVPDSWKSTMTSDPATNPDLKKYSEKSASPAEQYYRDMYLIALLSGCGTLDIRLKTFFEYEAKIGFGGFSEKEIMAAKAAVDEFGRGMDVKTAAHLCAGGEYLFGDKGVLVPGVLRFNGTPFDPQYNPGDTTIRMEIDKIEQAFKRNRK